MVDHEEACRVRETRFVRVKSDVSNCMCVAINCSKDGKIDEKLLNNLANEHTDEILKTIDEMG